METSKYQLIHYKNHPESFEIITHGSMVRCLNELVKYKTTYELLLNYSGNFKIIQIGNLINKKFTFKINFN